MRKRYNGLSHSRSNLFNWTIGYVASSIHSANVGFLTSIYNNIVPLIHLNPSFLCKLTVRHLANLNEYTINVKFFSFASFVVSKNGASNFDVSLDFFEFRVPQNLYLLCL